VLLKQHKVNKLPFQNSAHFHTLTRTWQLTQSNVRQDAYLDSRTLEDGQERTWSGCSSTTQCVDCHRCLGRRGAIWKHKRCVRCTLKHDKPREFIKLTKKTSYTSDISGARRTESTISILARCVKHMLISIKAISGHDQKFELLNHKEKSIGEYRSVRRTSFQTMFDILCT